MGTNLAIATDPVCGMEVDKATSLLNTRHEGTIYYFCSSGCKAAFERDPAGYLAAGYKPSMLGAMLSRVRGLFASKHA